LTAKGNAVTETLLRDCTVPTERSPDVLVMDQAVNQSDASVEPGRAPPRCQVTAEKGDQLR
jgi:hypothetical protein